MSSPRPSPPSFGCVAVVGRGRVGAAVAGRLSARGISVLGGGDVGLRRTGHAVHHSPEEKGPVGGAARGFEPHSRLSETDLVLLCVPDGAIAQVSRSVPEGPWVAHMSGATPLASLAPHRRCFSVHPLQTFTTARGSDQFDGAWGAVTATSPDALSRATWLAECLGLQPFPLADDHRVLYHAGAVIASNYLVGMHRAAARLFREVGAPPEALVPLMRRTIENGFDLTGPVARGDWSVVDAHVAALRTYAPELEAMYRAMAAVIAS